MGWWHWITPKSEKLHMHLFFNNDQFETALSSNMLRLTPPEVFALSYGVDPNKIGDVLNQIDEAVEIGPPTPKTRQTYTSITNQTKPQDVTNKNQKNEGISININGKNLKP
jgi:hypothetical protein